MALVIVSATVESPVGAGLAYMDVGEGREQDAEALPANSLATRSVAGKARSYTHDLLAETMTNA